MKTQPLRIVQDEKTGKFRVEIRDFDLSGTSAKAWYQVWKPAKLIYTDGKEVFNEFPYLSSATVAAQDWDDFWRDRRHAEILAEHGRP